MSDEIDQDSLREFVALQAQTPCRKCKAVDWSLEEGSRIVHGGDRVGIFVVLGPRTDRVHAVTFKCKKCGVTFERPVYSRAQLASQQFPTVKLDMRADDGNRNGT